MSVLRRSEKGWLRDSRVWIGVAVLFYTLFGFFGVPWILRSQIVKQCRRVLGREATLEAVSFNPFTLAARFRGFELKDRDGSRLLAFEELAVNLQLSGLFRRAWTFREIRLVRPHGVARILPDGRPAVADLFEKTPPEPEAAGPWRPPRLLVGVLEVISGQIDFKDESHTPPFGMAFEPLSLRVAGLSTIPDRTGDHVVSVGIEGGAQIRWSGRASMEPLRLQGTVEVSGLRLPRLWEYVGGSFPLALATGEAGAKLSYSVEKPAGQALRAEIRDASLDATGLSVRPRGSGDDWLKVERIDVQGASVRWPDATAEVDSIRISAPALRAWIAEDGRINWLGLLPEASASPSPAASSAPPWKASLAALEIAGGSVHLEDRTVSQPVTLALDGIEARLENLTSHGSSPVGAKLSAKVNGSGSLSAGGTLGLRPPAADLDVDLGGVELKEFQPYAAKFVRVRIAGGAVALHGKASYREGGSPLARFEGRASVERLDLANPDGERVLAWEGLDLEKMRLSLSPNRLQVGRVAFKRPFGQILIDREGKLDLAKLVVGAPAGEPAPAAAPAAASLPSSFPYDIGSITFDDAAVDYGDRSLVLPFAAKIHSGKGSVTDLSSRSAAASPVVFEGQVDEYGFAKVDGSIRFADPYASTEVRVLFRNIAMRDLSPYTAQFAGYAIQSGRLDLDVVYRIRDRALVGDHRLTATELTLGDKVEGGEASLPLRLAVALLKDKDGKVELDVPIEGSIDDPQFAYRKVIWQALKTILVNVAAAPFRFLGRLMGIEGDDLEFVEFEAGRGEMLPPEREKLGKLVEGLRSRPELHLEVGGRFDPVSDAAAIRRAKLDARIAARREALAGSSTEDAGPVLDRVLEDLYAETFSAEAREALRQKHSTVPAAGEGKKGAPPAQPAVNAAAFLQELRSALLEAQVVGADDLAGLARSRAEAIVTALTSEGGIDAARVSRGEEEQVRKRRKGGDDRLVPCQLTLAAR